MPCGRDLVAVWRLCGLRAGRLPTDRVHDQSLNQLVQAHTAAEGSGSRHSSAFRRGLSAPCSNSPTRSLSRSWTSDDPADVRLHTSTRGGLRATCSRRGHRSRRWQRRRGRDRAPLGVRSIHKGGETTFALSDLPSRSFRMKHELGGVELNALPVCLESPDETQSLSLGRRSGCDIAVRHDQTDPSGAESPARSARSPTRSSQARGHAGHPVLQGAGRIQPRLLTR